MTLTENELREMERLVYNATPGPWTISSQTNPYTCYATTLGTRCLVSATRMDDIKFIRAARTDMPRLLLEIRRLQVEIQDLKDPSHLKRSAGR